MNAGWLNEIKVYFCFILFVFTYTGCGDKNELEYTLRSDTNEYYYNINKADAANRVKSIMYATGEADLLSSSPSERFKLIHISDAHLSNASSDNNYKNPNNLIEAVTFANQPDLRINAMVATGDHINDNSKYIASLFMESFVQNLYKDNTVPTFACFGNHDSNMMGHYKNYYFSTPELFNFFYNKVNYPLQQENGTNYYYADVANPMGGYIRFIALDMLDQPGNEINTLYNVVYSQKQINWLADVALKKGMTEQHSVVILTHFPFQPKWGHYLCDGDYIHSWKIVPEIVEAFRTKQAIQRDYSSKFDSFKTIQVDADFTNTPGEFICHLGGHAHITAQFEITGLSNQSEELLPQQMLLCTNMSPSEIGTVYNKVPRRSKSLSNNSFCIYAIDTIEKKIYITFFGAYIPEDASSHPEIVEISYLK